MPDLNAWLSLSLFGPAALQFCDAGGRAQPVALCAQSRSLLAVLALARGSVRSRDELCRTLWDEAGERGRAGSLSSALWRLRQAVERPPFAAGDVISCDRSGGVALRPGEHLRIDIESYLQRVLPPLAKPLEAMDEADVQQLREAVALYSGELLAGLQDDWALREREKMRRHQLHALGRLVQRCIAAGDAAAGIRHAQAILELDALREDVHRQLMRLYLMAGQRALALRQFETCRAALMQELGIVPMRETQALYRHIAEHAIGAPGASGPGGEAGPADPPAGDADLAALVASARAHLAAAETQLQRAAPLCGRFAA